MLYVIGAKTKNGEMVYYNACTFWSRYFASAHFFDNSAEPQRVIAQWQMSTNASPEVRTARLLSVPAPVF